jgi:hypothetical protein
MQGLLYRASWGISLAKSHQRRESKKAAVERSKQSTLDELCFQFNIQKPNDARKSVKEIVISSISNDINEDELALSTEFNLLPSKLAFSKINLDLYFEDQLLKSITLGIPQSPLLNDSFVFPLILNMRGISAGKYLVRVEMYELWPSKEKLSFVSKEIITDYIPKKRESRLVKIPIVKNVTVSNLTVVSSNEKSIYLDLEQDLKKESLSQRDQW